MNIELITTGSELLLGFTHNTHLDYIARQLLPLGHRIARHTTIGDDPVAMTDVIRAALKRADILFLTGGLGPTSDDITRDIVARLLSRPLQLDETVANTIRERFRSRGREMPEKNLVQAMVPRCAQVLSNPNGTAPGLCLEHDGKKIFLLPGPPRELQPMFANHVLPLLPVIAPLNCRVFKVVGLPESIVEEKVAPLLADLDDIELGYCARSGEVEVRIISKLTSVISTAEARIRAALGDNIFSADADRLEDVVVKMLAKSGKTVTVAESCTGGLIAHRLTNVSGSSAVFRAGYVTYSNAAKQHDLGVRAESLEKFGAVSENVAIEMASGVRQHTSADFGLSATGIAGPNGGTQEKPVGLVFIGLATPSGTKAQRFQLGFDRETFKFFVSQTALDMLRREILMKNV